MVIDPTEATLAVGQRRIELLAELAAVERQLHGLMREMREAGATQVEVMAASSYRSLDAVRKILDPQVKGKAADARHRRSGKNDGRATASGVVLTSDATEAAIAASGFRGGR